MQAQKFKQNICKLSLAIFLKKIINFGQVVLGMQGCLNIKKQKQKQKQKKSKLC